MAATSVFFKITPAPPNSTISFKSRTIALSSSSILLTASGYRIRQWPPFPCIRTEKSPRRGNNRQVWASSSSAASASDSTSKTPKTRLFVSGLSFHTTEESLRKAFQNFGQLVSVNLVMDKVANRPRGFAFLRYATEEESQKAIEGMHGKFLDGRVIFVEVAKSRTELRQDLKHKQS